MSQIQLAGTSVHFVIGEHASGKKIALMMFQSGDIQVMIPFDAETESAQQFAQVMVNGIMSTAAEVLRQNHGGLIIPQIHVDPNKMNGSQNIG